MGRTFLEILPLALGGAISPVLVLLQLATLASGVHPVLRAAIVLTVLLLGTALRLLLTDQRADQPAETSPVDTAAGPLRPLRFLLLGVGAMATNATTLVLLIPAVHTVATAGLRGTQELSLYVTTAFIVLLPAYLPLLALGALGRRGPAALANLSTWLGAHNRTVEIVVSLGFAVFLGWTGFSALS